MKYENLTSTLDQDYKNMYNIMKIDDNIVNIIHIFVFLAAKHI